MSGGVPAGVDGPAERRYSAEMVRGDAKRGLTGAFGALGLAALLAATQGFAETAGVSLAELGVERWTPGAGLAGSWVADIAEDRGGFLWLATSGGLSRFDGHGFRSFSARTEGDLDASAMKALAVGPDGRLWVGLEHGGVRVFEGGGLRKSPEVGGLLDVVVTSLAADAAGTLWIATEGGLWRSGRNGASTFPLPGRAATGEVRQVRVAPDGSVWARTRDHGLFRIANGMAERLEDPPECRGLSIAFAPDGHPVTSCVKGVWERRNGDAAWTLVDPSVSVGRVFVDRGGALWFGGPGGLTRRAADGTTEVLPVAQGVGDERVYSLFEDSRGDLWVGTYAEGLSRLRRGAVRSPVPRGRLPHGESTAVAADARGDVWIGTSQHGLFRWRPSGGPLRNWSKADGLPSDKVWAVAPDPVRDDRVWVGTEQGIAVVEGDGVLRAGRPLAGIEGPVTILYADPALRGTVWAAGPRGGAYEIRPGSVVRHDARDGLDSGRVRAFHRGRDGALLAAGDRGAFRCENGRWRAIAPRGKELRELRAVAEQPDGTLWLASAATGLLRASGGMSSVLGEREGLPFNNVFSLELDGRGGLWLSGDEGLVRIGLDDVERWVRKEIESVPAARLGERDGLRDRECNGWGRPASARLPDGSLVYPTFAGIAVVDPSRLPMPVLTPGEVFVDRASTGARELSPTGRVRLGAGERDLRLAFGCIEFEIPESVLFRYVLEGLDARWVPAGGGREATYAHVPPGRYRFRLQARLPGQEWVEAHSTPEVVVTPTLVESTWFRALAALLVFGSLVGGVVRRFRVQRAHANEISVSREELRRLASALLKAQEEERARLARELHDDLTQRLAGLAMLTGGYAQAVRRCTMRDLPPKLEELGHELEKLARDSQSISRELHPSLLERVGLDGALRAECATFGARTGLKIDYESRDVPDDLAPEVGIVLYRIAQEALRNVVSHSGANEARVSLAGTGGALELTVEDGGRGFDPTACPPGSGLGLSSMAERARLVRGKLTIESSPGAGTRVRLLVRPDAHSGVFAALR